MIAEKLTKSARVKLSFANLPESSIRVQLLCSRQRGTRVQKGVQSLRERERERDSVKWVGGQLKLPNGPQNKTTRAKLIFLKLPEISLLRYLFESRVMSVCEY